MCMAVIDGRYIVRYGMLCLSGGRCRVRVGLIELVWLERTTRGDDVAGISFFPPFSYIHNFSSLFVSYSFPPFSYRPLNLCRILENRRHEAMQRYWLRGHLPNLCYI